MSVLNYFGVAEPPKNVSNATDPSPRKIHSYTYTHRALFGPWGSAVFKSPVCSQAPRPSMDPRLRTLQYAKVRENMSLSKTVLKRT